MDASNNNGLNETFVPPQDKDLQQLGEKITTEFRKKHKPISKLGLSVYVLASLTLIVFSFWLTFEIKQWVMPQKAQAAPKPVTVKSTINTEIPTTQSTRVPTKVKTVTSKPARHTTTKPTKTATSGPTSKPAVAGGFVKRLLGAFGAGSGSREKYGTAPTTTQPARPELGAAQFRRLLAAMEQAGDETPWLDRVLAFLPAKAEPEVPVTPGPHAGTSTNDRYGPTPTPVNSYSGPRPTNPKNTKTTKGKPVIPEARFKLSGILVRDGQPTAVINDKHVRVGDFVEDAKVTRIDKYSVELDVEGQLLTIRI